MEPLRIDADPERTIVALDVGGAHLKAADGRGFAAIRPFDLWREPQRLADELRELVAGAPPFRRVAATMTGELCDCFATKSDGVRAIVDAVLAVAGERRADFYLTDGRLASADSTRAAPRLAAASNWHALASFAARFCDGAAGLLIDVGSTTVDVVPLADGRCASRGTTDTERLAAGELIYMGVERTPVATLVDSLPWGGGTCPVAREFFATTVDVYLTLNDLPEGRDNTATADGRPRTRTAARARLARMIGADVTTFSELDAQRVAEAVRDRQASLLATAIDAALGRTPAPCRLILSGAGEFLARLALPRLVGRPLGVTSLAERLGAAISRVAPAHGLAVLASERQDSVG